MTERKNGPEVLVTGRWEGKTWALMGWLLEGELVPAWPHWSRGVIVADDRRADWLTRSLHAIRECLRNEGVDMRSLLTTPEQVQLREPMHDTEFAVDDAELVLSRYLGCTLARLTVTGTAIPNPRYAPGRPVSEEDA